MMKWGIFKSKLKWCSSKSIKKRGKVSRLGKLSKVGHRAPRDIDHRVLRGIRIRVTIACFLKQGLRAIMWGLISFLRAQKALSYNCYPTENKCSSVIKNKVSRTDFRNKKSVQLAARCISSIMKISKKPMASQQKMTPSSLMASAPQTRS